MEHARRFFDSEKPNYSGAFLKALVIIGSSRAIVRDRIDVVKEQGYATDGLEVIGLVHAKTSESYEMILPEEEDGIVFVCDRVAKSLDKGTDGLPLSAQRLVRRSIQYDERR